MDVATERRRRRRTTKRSKQRSVQGAAPKSAPTLVGHWRKRDAEALLDPYPVEIVFAESTYRGSRAPEQGLIWWDAGIYRLDDPGTLVLSTATDEMVSYPIELDADRLAVTTPGHGRIVYERRAEPPPS
jgi:hypothetical protein